MHGQVSTQQKLQSNMHYSSPHPTPPATPEEPYPCGNLDQLQVATSAVT
jgi:hypothetical protein